MNINKKTKGLFIAITFLFMTVFFYNYHSDEIPIEFSEEFINVCFLDNFKRMGTYDTSHGERVVAVFEKYNSEDVNIIKLDFKEYGFHNLDSINLLKSHKTNKVLNSCDFINYSMGSTNRKDGFMRPLLKFIKNYEGVLSVTAGNSDLTYNQSEWSALRKKYDSASWNQKLFVSSQGRVIKKNMVPTLKEDVLIVETSTGPEVDFVVDKEISQIDDIYRYKGSSFATPVITAYLVSEKTNADFLNKNGFSLALKQNSVKQIEGNSHIYKTLSWD